MSGSLKPYFYFILRAGTAANSLQKCVKTFRVVGDGEYVCQNFAFRAENKAVVLILGTSIPTQIIMNTSGVFLSMLVPQDTLLL